MNSQHKITLKAARVNAGLEIKEAAEKIGVATSTLVKWEKDPSVIKIKYLNRIEKAYGYPTDLIFFGNQLELKSSFKEGR